MNKSGGKTALVTGTSSGIGLAAAIELAKADFAVTATMRDPRKADALLERAKAEGVSLDVRPLDVTDDGSVAAAVTGVIDRYGRLDVLVNNAGAGHLGTTEQVSVEELQRVMDVNLYGVWRVTRAVLPHLRRAGGGRVINVSSVGGLFGQPFNDAYSAAKFALEGMSESLAPVAAQFGVRVCLVEPGPVNTQFIASVGGMARLGDEHDPYRALMLAYAEGVRTRFADTGQSAEEVAQTIAQAATDEQPRLRYQTSAGVRARAAQKLVDPDGYAFVEAASRTLA